MSCFISNIALGYLLLIFGHENVEYIYRLLQVLSKLAKLSCKRLKSELVTGLEFRTKTSARKLSAFNLTAAAYLNLL